MKFKEYLETTCRESSVHGLPYLVRKELHWSERVLWGAIVLSATYFSINVCLNQWQRFRDNPIVYQLEMLWDKKDLPYAGITFCTDYSNDGDTAAIIAKTWNVTLENERYKYYREFLLVLNNLHFDTLAKLEPYSNDESLKNLDLLAIIVQMRARAYSTNTSKEEPTMRDARLFIEDNSVFAPAITETGLCYTTSQVSEYTNPFGEIKHLPVLEMKYCGFLRDCDTVVSSDDQKYFTWRIYLHSVADVSTPHHRSTVFREVKACDSLTVELFLNWITAESEVRWLPIAYRKCRYSDENNLKYFQIYRPGLCRMECRIDSAIKLCNCKPYFYAVAPRAPLCGIDGLLCLAEKNWTDVRCDCLPLCEEVSYSGLQSIAQSNPCDKFERNVAIKLNLKTMAMKRHVVFSTDQLIMSFGGAISLFLGASFISICGFINLFSVYVTSNVEECIKGQREEEEET